MKAAPLQNSSARRGACGCTSRKNFCSRSACTLHLSFSLTALLPLFSWGPYQHGAERARRQKRHGATGAPCVASCACTMPAYQAPLPLPSCQLLQLAHRRLGVASYLSCVFCGVALGGDHRAGVADVGRRMLAAGAVSVGCWRGGVWLLTLRTTGIFCAALAQPRSLAQWPACRCCVAATRACGGWLGNRWLLRHRHLVLIALICGGMRYDGGACFSRTA